MTCPGARDLERLVRGDIGPEARGPLESHVAGCAACRERSDEISQNLDLIERARDVWQTSRPESGHPETVGPFRILHEIGRGGMGIVYLAEQDRPRRQVALKVLRPGLASPAVLRRFETEANLLARLDHPNIARVLETGIAEVRDTSGWSEPRPWFAMEHSSGLTLDAWVDARKPNARTRVELLAGIADAVHHAHLKGVVHRDLKPGNVLVEEAEGEGSPRPRVLDFGVARSLDSEAMAPTFDTEVGRILGTLPFMSPEQVLGDSSMIDARSDIYSLGVVAFWLLSSRLPYTLHDRSLPDAVRIIREDDPGKLGGENGPIPADLETIVRKCLEKEPDRRYASASALADDLRAFLADEPIRARPPSAMYTLGKFVRRNRLLVGAAAALFVVAVTAAVVGTSLAVRARQAEDAAARNLEQADAVNEFLVEMLGSANPELGGDRETTVREAMDDAAEKLDDGRLAGHPATEAAVRRVLGTTYGVLGQLDAAERHLRAALVLHERAGGSELHDYLRDLGFVLLDRGTLSEAEALLRRAAEIARTGQPGGWPRAQANLAVAVSMQGRFEEAQVLLEEVLANPAVDDDLRSSVLANLGAIRFDRGDLDGAIEATRRSLALTRRVRGNEHPETLAALGNLGRGLTSRGDYVDAERVTRETLEVGRRVYGDEHPFVAEQWNNLGLLLWKMDGREAEAEEMLRRALSLKRTALGAHANTARSLNDLAQFLRDRERYEEAEPLYREAIDVYARTLGEDHPHRATVLSNLARLRAAQGHVVDAESLLTEALAVRRETLGPEHDATREIERELAALRD